MVFDAGPLINLSRSCALDVLSYLPTRKVITPSVYEEVYERPLRNPMYARSALLIKRWIGREVHLTELSENEKREVLDLSRKMNSLFYRKGIPLRIVHPGELETLVVARRREGVMVVDERTVRLVLESPEDLKKRLERKYGRITVNRSLLEHLKERYGRVFMVRSVDIVAYAFENGYLGDVEELEALMYSLKYGGCAVSTRRIKEYLSGLQKRGTSRSSQN